MAQGFWLFIGVRSTDPRAASLGTVLVKKEAFDGLESFWLPLNNQWQGHDLDRASEFLEET